MTITVCPSAEAFDLVAAWRIIGQMLSKPTSVIGLSTGQTTMGMHRIVSEVFTAHPFDVSRVTLFNVDELTNLPRTYSGSCYTMIRTQLADALGIPDERFLMPPTLSDDFVSEALLWESRIAAAGGADLQMLGIGLNGHIGINQPGTPFESETWVSPMDPDFEARVRRETQVPPGTELGGLTRGIKNIMHTRKIVLIAKGAHKADIVAQAVRGPITTDIPASVVQLHPDCEILLDAAAAGKI